jgi:PAS domain S-box-containing protein
MRQRQSTAVASYLLAIAAAAAAVAVRWLLDPFLGDHLPLVTLYAAIAVGVWLGGVPVAILIVVVGYLACDFLFIEPRGMIGIYDTRNLIGLLAHLATCSVLIGLGEAMRKARQRSRDRGETMRVALANISDGVIATDANGLITFMNGVAESLTGWRAEDARDKPLREVFLLVDEQSRLPLDDPARAMTQDKPAAKSGGFMLVAKDGTERPIENNGASIRNSAGQIIGTVLDFRDITERRKSELARAQLANIVETADDAIISKDLNGIITSWNTAAETLFGYTAAEAIGQPITLIIPPERLGEEDEIISRLRKGQRIEHFETVRVTRDGSRIDISLSVSPVKDSSNRVTGASKIARDISQRKRTEAELSESRERLRMAMEAGQMGTWARELDGTDRTRWSPELERIFGLDPGEFPETVDAFFDFVLPEDHAAVREVAADAIDNHNDFSIEFRYRRKGETAVRWMASAGRAFYDAEGKPLRVAGLGWDITARRRAEEALREHREWLRVTLSSIGDAVIATDINGLVTFLNPVAESLTGCSQEEAAGQPIQELLNIVNEETREKVENPALRAIRTGGIVAVTNHTVLIARDGTEIAIDESGAPIKDAAGRIVGAVLIFRDTTERRRAEDRFRIAVESAPNAVVMIDGNGGILLVNNQTERLFGYTREELIGQPIEKLVPKLFGGNQHVYQVDVPNQPKENPVRTEGYLFGLRKDGTEVPIEIGLNPIEVKGEARVLSSIVDVSERKRAEQERALLLSSERAARERAENASRAKDEFVAMVSHELRAPLNIILGWTQVLRKARLNAEETASALETIERGARTQVQLIEDLLDVSRAITGKLVFNPRPVEVRRIIEAAVEAVRPAADAKSIRLHVKLDPKGGWVLGDPSRLQQIVWNLLSNAVKFTTKSGSVQVTMERHNSQLQIRVSDSGVGINPEFLPHVFDRFSQAKTSSDRRYGGLGLGLAIVKHLSELHGGSIHADSPGEGQGATFAVTLPINEAYEEAMELEGGISSAAESVHDAISLEGIRVMIVDDDEDTRDLLLMALTGVGAEVRTCASAAEALEVIARFRPSVLVSDLGMPDQDGYALIRMIRMSDADRGRDVPAVALTGYATTEDRKRALAAGFQTHVPKPVDTSELAMVIASLAKRVGKSSSA